MAKIGKTKLEKALWKRVLIDYMLRMVIEELTQFTILIADPCHTQGQFIQLKSPNIYGNDLGN